MNFLSNLKISAKLLLLTSIPTLALIIFAGIAVLDKMEVSAQMSNVETMSRISARISALVHEMQAERGMTAGFLASGGKSFAGQIDGQRRTVDEKATLLQDFLKSINTTILDPHFMAKLNDGLSALGSRQDTRQRISALNIPTTEAIGYFTKANGIFLSAVGEMYEEAVTAEGASVVMAYSNFLQAKERAGDRAVAITDGI